MDRKRSDTYISILVYLYLALPTLIFFAGWLRWYWALPCCILTVYACTRGFTESMQNGCLISPVPIDRKNMIKMLLIIALWVYLSGIGGYCLQGSDYEYRSAIFRALVERDWPVASYDGSRSLVYYIGFWLPAACVGKVFGMEAGNAAQYLWAVVGIFIVCYLMCVYRGKTDFLPLAFLVLFSGLDYVGAWILGEEGTDLSLAYHLEWWAQDFQFTSMTAQLFWVFNQALPAWLATMLVMMQKNSKNILLILSLSMLTTTIPFVGLIPIAVYLYVRCTAEDSRRWKEVFTVQNFVGVLVVGIVIFMYLIGNILGTKIRLDHIAVAAIDAVAAMTTVTATATATAAAVPVSEPMAGLLRYLLFCFLEFGVYLYFVYRYRKKDPLLFLIVCILLVCPFIKVGNGYDFCMRASVPSLFILMLFCMETFEKLRLEGRKYLFTAYCVVLLLGAITPFNEIHRSISETFWRATYGESVRYPEVSIEDRLLQSGNFSGNTEGNFFYQHLAKEIRTYTVR